MDNLIIYRFHQQMKVFLEGVESPGRLGRLGFLQPDWWLELAGKALHIPLIVDVFQGNEPPRVNQSFSFQDHPSFGAKNRLQCCNNFRFSAEEMKYKDRRTFRDI